MSVAPHQCSHAVASVDALTSMQAHVDGSWTRFHRCEPVSSGLRQNGDPLTKYDITAFRLVD